MRKLNPSQLLVIGFISVSLIGGFLLWAIPGLSRQPLHPIDALFTATSAVCVTGLIVKDTANDFTFWGQLLILILIQIGGLGIMTFSSLLMLAIRGRISFRSETAIREALAAYGIYDITRFIYYVLVVTALTELIGAVGFFIFWKNTLGKTAVWASIFHAVSAFCNAGFSIFSDSLCSFRNNLGVNLTAILLIFTGGIGFVVLLDLRRHFLEKRPLTLHSKIAIKGSIALIIIGFVFILISEANNTLKKLPEEQGILIALFQAVTPRTCGFNTVPISNLNETTLTFLMILMFIGASPGGTGGGIKTTTFFTIAASMRSLFLGRKDVEAGERRISPLSVKKAYTLAALAIGVILIFLLALTFSERNNMAIGPNRFLKLMFETVSAFGTVGLSTGITPHLTYTGKVIIIIAMLTGRVGPLTLAVALSRESPAPYSYPEEEVMIG